MFAQGMFLLLTEALCLLKASFYCSLRRCVCSSHAFIVRRGVVFAQVMPLLLADALCLLMTCLYCSLRRYVCSRHAFFARRDVVLAHNIPPQPYELILRM